MSFFESLLALLLAAIALLQLSRRLSLPYPPMLAAAGMLVALIPGAPTVHIVPETALAVFIAPALLDAAYDFPVGEARRFWLPLLILSVVAVLLTTALVAWLGVTLAGLPIAAAIVLGAIVAPPDAAAATAVLRIVRVPRSTATVLQGESLFNDATALLLYGTALIVQQRGGLSDEIGLRLLIAVPGGIALGMGLAYVSRRTNPFVSGTLGGSVLQFVVTCGAWVIATRLQLSAVLCVVTFAMTLASGRGRRGAARMRVHSYAVWATVVFGLNVFAFLVMGMQVRTIVAGMHSGDLGSAVLFAGLVATAVVLVRFPIVMTVNRLAAYFPALRSGTAQPPLLRQGLIVSWCGMRGLVTIATAFALPDNFPKRDLIALTAFGVVLATLVLQGLTLAPFIRLLRLDSNGDLATELTETRALLSRRAFDLLCGETGAEAESLRYAYGLKRAAHDPAADSAAFERHRKLALSTLAAQRDMLEELHHANRIGTDSFNTLEEELDWRELSLLPEDDRRIEEN